MNGDEPNDTQTTRLLDRIRSGDDEARNELLSRHRGALRYFISLRTGRALRNRIDVSDIVQEALMESSRRLNDYLNDSHGVPFRVWLRRMAYDRVLMMRRRHLGSRRRTVRRELPFPEASSAALAAHLFAGGSSPSEHLSKQELADKIRNTIDELEDGHKEILLLRTYEGFSYQEAAWILGIEVDAARQRFARALLRLNRLLSARGIEGA